MRQVAVALAHQNKGVGAYLVEKSEQWARKNGFKRMVLHARETAVPFYHKLNYLTIGERFEEVGIPHFIMERNRTTGVLPRLVTSIPNLLFTDFTEATMLRNSN